MIKNKIKKIEKKWFKRWRKEFPEDFGNLERENLDVPEEFGKDLEKITDEFAKRFGSRLSIPKEDDNLESFTHYSDV